MPVEREKYEPIARADARKYGVPEDLFVKQITQESGWNPQARSPSNAIGLAQIIARWHPDVDPTDPIASLDYAAKWMADLHRRFGSWKLALMGYNWGPQATLEWAEAGADDAKIRGETRRYLDHILGAGWPEPGGVAVPPSIIFYEDFRDPQPAGRFTSVPKGVILHGSRSGVAGNPKEKETLGTARYEVNNTDDLGWHATIGENHVCIHLTPQEWGWNARGCSDTYLAVEIAQATVDEPITDPQVAALADYIKTRLRVAWPKLPMSFPSHAELDGTPEYGPKDGKSDVFPNGDVRMNDLRARLLKALGPASEVPVPSTYSVGPGILAAMQAHADDPATDEMFTKRGDKDEWSEAYGTSGARYLYLPATNRVHRYDPAA